MGQYYSAITVDSNGNTTNYSLQNDKFRTTDDYNYYNGVKLMEHSWVGNSFTDAFSKMLYHNPMTVAWVGDYANTENGSAHQRLAKFGNVISDAYKKNEVDVKYSARHFGYRGKYFVNHTTKTYIPCSVRKPNKWVVYPLSLLTAVGNGLGCGDYSGNDEWLVGSWAFDTISIEDTIPEGYLLDDVPNFWE